MSIPESIHFIPLLSVHPNKVVCYSEPTRPMNRVVKNAALNFLGAEAAKAKEQNLSLEEQKELVSEIDNFQKGELSKNAKRKLFRAIDYLLFLAPEKTSYHFKTKKPFKWKVNFITMTLPAKQFHTDNEIKKKCLDPFLLELKRYHAMRNYIWRAERQKNGNIHFHILADQYIHYSVLRNRWNRITERLGYITKFEQKNKHRTPNSTDVHSLSRVKNVRAYVAKYVSKAEKGNPIKGRIWGCSQNLSNIKGAQDVIDYGIAEEIKQLAKSKEVKPFYEKYFSVFSFESSFLFKNQFPRLQALFDSYLNTQFNYSRQSSALYN